MKTPSSGALSGGRRRAIGWLILALVGIGVGGFWMAQSTVQGADTSRSNGGAVQFVLTPHGVSNGQFRVDVQVSTHSGDLAQLDLQSATELRVADQVLRPLESVALRGHHARGRMAFALQKAPQQFEIVIRGVRGMDDLSFRWP